jgi:hypothetical protein
VSQVKAPKFGSGLLNVTGKDSSFTMKVGFRFQNLATSSWNLEQNESDVGPDIQFLIRRSRLKFGGYAFSPNLVYKFEMGLSNRDVGGANQGQYGFAPRLILDAYVRYQFYKNWFIQFGQCKLPGNRERVVSSGDLQFVDRSRLNSRYNIDRDVGFQLRQVTEVSNDFFINTILSVSKGEGRNVTSENIGGLDYTIRVEALPFGKFQSKGDYVGSSIKKESRPKLSLGVAYDINNKASKTRGQNGSFMPLSADFQGRTLYTWFADLMFKYQNFSVMSEYVYKSVEDDQPLVIVDNELLGVFYTGQAFNVQAGYMIKKGYEIAGRFTRNHPDTEVDSDENIYTLGVNKFIVGHKLKLQTDISYVDEVQSSDELVYRFQMDLHF